MEEGGVGGGCCCNHHSGGQDTGQVVAGFFFSSHDATLSQPGLHVAQHASTSAPLIRCFIFQRAASGERSVMAGTLTERSIKWQLCYDMTARTWWMVSGALLSPSLTSLSVSAAPCLKCPDLQL